MPIFDSAERRYIRRGEVDVDSARRAKALLDELRRTRMLRGGRISEHKQTLRSRISGAIARRAVLPRLAERVAFQLVLKVDTGGLGDRAVWLAIGDRLQKEIESLKSNLALVDRQIVVALPKLSADQVAALHDELQAADPAVARTILNVALDAAEPIPAARRYLAAFHRIVDDLGPIDPGIARTVANATFMAHAPSRKAMDHLKQFATLARKFEDDVEFVRTVAKMAFRASDPIEAARGFIADYERVVAELTATGAEPAIARSIASIASTGADPMSAARTLLRHFEDVVAFAKRTHPCVARSIALSACRATDALTTARLYMKNYDAIVRFVCRTDPEIAHAVAAQAFRSDQPLRWAKRYLEQLKEERRLRRSTRDARQAAAD